MFKTPKVPCWLQNFTGQGEDEKKEIRFTLYVNPITYGLAAEVSPHLADRLFRNIGGEWSPVSEMPKAVFTLGGMPAQRATFYPHNDELVEMYGVLVENCKISGIQATRAFPDKPEFRLEFAMTVPMDEVTMGLIRRFYKEQFFLSTAPMQPELFDDPVMDLLCRLCDTPNPEFATTDGKFAYCAKCAINKEPGEHLKRIRDHAKADKVAADMAREPGDEPRENPLAEDINQKNQMGRRKKSALRTN